MRGILLILVASLCIGTSGCTGPFELTHKVHDFQTDFDNQWMDELVFLGFAILPVYSLSILADAIIFNSIDFWTGDSPVELQGRDPDLQSTRVAVQREDLGNGIVRLTAGKVSVLVDTSTLQKAQASD